MIKILYVKSISFLFSQQYLNKSSLYIWIFPCKPLWSCLYTWQVTRSLHWQFTKVHKIKWKLFRNTKQRKCFNFDVQQYIYISTVYTTRGHRLRIKAQHYFHPLLMRIQAQIYIRHTHALAEVDVFSYLVEMAAKPQHMKREKENMNI